MKHDEEVPSEESNDAVLRRIARERIITRRGFLAEITEEDIDSEIRRCLGEDSSQSSPTT